MVVFKQNSGVNIVLDDDITRYIWFHNSLLLKLKETMLDERLTEERKCVEFLSLKYFDKGTFRNIFDYFEQNCNV